MSLLWVIKCKKLTNFYKVLHLLQIGGNMFLTAAHCLENWAGEVQEPSELTLFLGVHNKNNLEDAK